jgi:hypothetical protein
MLRNILFIEHQVLRTDRHISLLSKFCFIFFRNIILEQHCDAATHFLKLIQLSRHIMCHMSANTSNVLRIL